MKGFVFSVSVEDKIPFALRFLLRPQSPSRRRRPPRLLLPASARPSLHPGSPMADSGARRQPSFTKVDQLRPGTHGHNLLLKVVDSKMVLQRGGGPQGRHMRIAECLVGDETGIIVFTARNDQVDVMKPGASVDLRNAKIDMFKGSMRLAVDKWGIVKAAESPADFTVKEDNNMSLIEFELVTVVE
uniref:Single-stranded DNA binding protein Ssb-like OB fold domain-containing protein n=3 Tax=Oryza TaxID=4527 RepID=A0A0E0KXD7_ORYPU